MPKEPKSLEMFREICPEDPTLEDIQNLDQDKLKAILRQVDDEREDAISRMYDELSKEDHSCLGGKPCLFDYPKFEEE